MTEKATRTTALPPPCRVALLVLPHASLLTVASTLDPLRSANRQLGREAFQWLVVSPGLTSVPLTCGLELPCQPTLAAAQGFDLLIVIAGFRIAEVITTPLLTGLRKLASSVGTMAAVDAGSWVLAKAGLLNGHRVTVHWEDLDALAQTYPDLEVVPDRFVISGNRITAGGAGPALDMTIDLIRRRFGARLAHEVATSFITATSDRRTPQQNPQYDGVAVDAKVSAAIGMMEATVSAPLRIRDIAARVRLSVRRLENLFQRDLGYSPGAFYAELRLQAVRRNLAGSDLNMAEIAVLTGFSCPSVLSRAFSRRFGESALAFRRRSRNYAGNGILRDGA
ncbi:GlxA family transcriptional regulator [Szabonella alba]|uniref:GlxA family transcriptional regulator n=1 Tax=Szabonella alba TaxID=2804194 RepID=A0A8K0VC90_9RHOB|nr:GlxA family transcriptional regulator [Szabonella alba]MBL4919046.1 GlxA family transcriptional regulator [Szabonella alba]